MSAEGQPDKGRHVSFARRHRGKLRSACAIIAIGVGLLIQHRVFKNRGDARLAAIKQQGLPIDVFELDQAYATPVGATNAADFYEQGFASLIDFDRADTNAPLFNQIERRQKIERGDGSPPGTVKFLQQWIATNQTSIALLHKGSQFPDCVYSHSYTSGYLTLPHLTKVMTSSLLLSWDAWLRAEFGDLDGAIHSLESALAVTESLANEPDAMAQSTRSNGLLCVAQRLEEILNFHRFHRSQLDRLGRLFEGRETPRKLRAAFAGQMSLGLLYFDDPFMGIGMTRPASERLRVSAAIRLRKASGSWSRDRDLFLDVYSRYIEAARQPFPNFLREADAIDEYSSEQCGEKTSWYSLRFLSWIHRVVETEVGRIAQLRIIQTAIAIERFRLANDDALPATLTELTPLFLPSVLTDPFDGQPLRYTRMEKGFVVYSIGVDREDGHADLENEEDHPDDIRFRILR